MKIKKNISYVILLYLIVFAGLLIYHNMNDSKKHEILTISHNNKYTERRTNAVRLNNTSEDYTLTSERYQIEEDYIYYGLDTLSTVTDYITCTNCSLNINNNQLEVTYNDSIVKTYDLVGIATKNYKLLDDYIYYGFENDIDITKITCTNCTPVKENNRLVIKYNNIVLKEYTLLGLTTNYTVNNRTIYVERDYGDDEAIINKINKSVCTLEIENNKRLLVKYNGLLIDNYSIAINHEISVANDYIIDENRMILYRVGANKLVSNLLTEINANATKRILNKNNLLVDDFQKVCTGYVLRITFNDDADNHVDYRISIPGDVLGIGTINKENAKKISQHVVDKNVITGDEYLLAADYDGNGNIKMNDVTRMLVDINNENINSDN